MKERESRQQDAGERNAKGSTSSHVSEKQQINNYPEISRMDKREGNLEHGETGGGFGPKEQEEKNKE